MSSSTNEVSPVVEPLHHPGQEAHQPRASQSGPLNNVTNNTEATDPVSLGQKALLANRMAKQINPKMISPTDNFMTPVTAKLSQAKKKHFSKGKPLAGAFNLASQPTLEQSESPAVEKSGIDF